MHGDTAMSESHSGRSSAKRRLDSHFSPRAPLAPAPVQLRADVTTTMYLDATGGLSTSSPGASTSTSKFPIAAVAGGLAGGVAIVAIGVLLWRCSRAGGRKRTRSQRDYPKDKDETKRNRPEWSPANSSFSHSHSSLGKGAFSAALLEPLPDSPTSPSPKAHHGARSTAASPRSTGPMPPSLSRSLSEKRGYRREGSQEGSDSKSSSEEGYVGPDDLGYSLPYDYPPETNVSGRGSHDPLARESTEKSLGKDDLNAPLPTPRSAHKARRRTRKAELAAREPLSPSSSLDGEVSSTNETDKSPPQRRYIPAKPSPLAQASYRSSVLSALSRNSVAIGGQGQPPMPMPNERVSPQPSAQYAFEASRNPSPYSPRSPGSPYSSYPSSPSSPSSLSQKQSQYLPRQHNVLAAPEPAYTPSASPPYSSAASPDSHSPLSPDPFLDPSRQARNGAAYPPGKTSGGGWYSSDQGAYRTLRGEDPSNNSQHYEDQDDGRPVSGVGYAI